MNVVNGVNRSHNAANYFFHLTQLHNWTVDCIYRSIENIKTKIIIIKKTRDLYISPPRGSATAETIFTKLGRVAETRNVITLFKFLIN